MQADTYNWPIAIFYANMLWHGIRAKVVNGELRIGGDLSSVSPVYRDEIVRRSEQLIDLLGTPTPEELAPYIGKVIPLADAMEGIGIAKQMRVKLRQFPVQRGWILFMPSPERMKA